MAVLITSEGREKVVHINDVREENGDCNYDKIEKVLDGDVEKKEMLDFYTFAFESQDGFGKSRRYWFAFLQADRKMMGRPLNRYASEIIGKEVTGDVLFTTCQEIGEKTTPELRMEKREKERMAREAVKAYEALEPVRRRARRIQKFKRWAKAIGWWLGFTAIELIFAAAVIEFLAFYHFIQFI